MNKVDVSRYTHRETRSAKKVAWYIVSIVFFQNSLFPFYSLKVFILRVFGAKVGRGVIIKPRVRIKYPWLLTIGNFVWIGESVWIDNLATVDIGDNCCVSQGAMLLTGNHDYTKPKFDLMLSGITLEEGVWLAAKSVVCPGVRAGFQAVLTVGSVATKDLEARMIYQGNPAVAIRPRNINP